MKTPKAIFRLKNIDKLPESTMREELASLAELVVQEYLKTEGY